MADSEVERIRKVYAYRDMRIDAMRYTPFDPAHLLLHYSRQRALLKLLKRRGIASLADRRLLEIGCGAAGILLEAFEYGALASNLFGIDLIPGALLEAQFRSPNLRLSCADGEALPFRSGSFDVVTAYTVFTSVLAQSVRERLASEMQRMVKPDGLLVVYDFWPNNPNNADVRGLTLRDVERLFPNCQLDVQRIVLAPPLARRLAPLSTLVCQLLEKLPWLCTHYLLGVYKASRPKSDKRAPSAASLTASIRLATTLDVPAIVAVHLASFPGFFLTFLGARFLQLLYLGILRGANGVLFVAVSDGVVVGFAAGVMRQSSFYRNLIWQQKWAFAVACLAAIVKRPTAIPRLWRALRMPDIVRQASAEACLMSIAVRPDAAGQGLGQQLVKAFCEELLTRGAPAVCLTTDRDHNDRVNWFYRQLGFQLSSTIVTPEGRALNEYYLPLRKAKT